MDEILGRLQEAALYCFISLIIVGLPGAGLKAIACQVPFNGAMAGKLLTLGKSVLGAAFAGMFGIVAFFLFVPIDQLPLIGSTRVTIGEAASIPVLILSASLFEWMAIRRHWPAMRGRSIAETGIAAALSNCWLAAGIWLIMFQVTAMLSGPCEDFTGETRKIGVDPDACLDHPRTYWTEHRDLWDKALEINRQFAD